MSEELEHLNGILLEALNSGISNIRCEKEPGDYCGNDFQLGAFNIKYRKAKITPKKIGQFVALWKRNGLGKTEPFSLDDNFNFYFIETQHEQNHGFFVFPKMILAEKQILSADQKGGKRGFRLYTPWDFPQNRQAKNSKSWQTLYFIDLMKDRKSSVGKLQEMVKL